MPPAQIPLEVKWYSKELKARSEAIEAANEERPLDPDSKETLRDLLGTLNEVDLSHSVMQHAIARLAQEAKPSYPTAQPKTDFDLACFAWLNLENASARHWFERLDPIFEDGSSETESIKAQELRLWVQAMEAFEQGERKTSKRFWSQAVKISGSFGTDAHPVIAWTYAATFAYA